LGSRVSSLSDVRFYSSKSGVKDGTVSPLFAREWPISVIKKEITL